MASSSSLTCSSIFSKYLSSMGVADSEAADESSGLAARSSPQKSINIYGLLLTFDKAHLHGDHFHQVL